MSGEATIDWVRDGERLDAAFALREAVFYGEQGVSAEEDLDELDEEAQHLVALDPEGRVIGTLRLLDFGEEAKIGRVVVAADQRRRGIASRMLAIALARASEQGFRRVRLAAQIRALELYAQAGFAVESEPFEEAGIPHVWMGLTLGD